MKNLWKLLSLVLVLGLGFASCSDDDDDESPNFVKIGEKTYALNGGLLEDYGNIGEEGIFNLDLVLHSSGIRYNSEMEEYYGKGNYVGFELYTGTEGDLDAGEYTSGSWFEPETMVYVSSVYALNIDLETAEEFYEAWDNDEVDIEDRPWIEGEMYGTLSLEKEGDKYIIEFAGLTEEEEVVVIHYEGKLSYFDFSDDGFYEASADRASGFSFKSLEK